MRGIEGLAAHNGGSRERRVACANLGSTNSSVLECAGRKILSRIGPKTQREQVVFKEELAHLIGGPRVVIERDGSTVTVWMHSPPWGWGNQARQFINPQSQGPERYAAELRERIRAACERERARKERLAAAKLRGDLG
jgi:hypothetical protein